MIDIADQINTAQRAMGNQAVAAGEGRSVLPRRVYDAPIEDVWSACTDPERLGRWLGPVEGMPTGVEVRPAPGDDIAAAIAFAVRHLAHETSGDR
ncbi:SRPBCC domain-containing protein [Streptosporangium minutum]|uniref:Activator of Hsp90 ATPase homologue 1/2-like C-terminal domain-containing protein n=1 Tax=Streptosporangium minutum TaxID=569862 RepID=A0A2C9ZLF9_9ACTN|nr:SRPBCC domain-containing protein [Streptosporangium minutum]OUC92169.1 hypothetical protein CA984_31140 [Streptosporangium minutum]